MELLLFVFRFVVLLVVLGYLGVMVWRRLGRPRLPLGTSKVALGLQKEPLKRCPQLGLSGDPFENAGRPDDDHRCYANLARERIDRGHQQMFCLSSSYKRCPFLAVAPQQAGLTERARAWWRSVSPGIPALANSQPGLRPWLGALAAMLMALLAVGRTWLANRSRPSVPSMPRVQVPAVAALLKTRKAESPAMTALLATHVTEEAPQAIVTEASPGLAEERQSIQMEEAPVVSHEWESMLEEEAPVVSDEWESMLVEEAEAAPVLMMAQDREEEEPIATFATVASVGTIVAPVKMIVSEDAELVTAGIAALEIGNEVEAQHLFERATQMDKHDVRAWYWRAKTSDTLEDVVKYLERAYALDNSNQQIAENLLNAHERLQALKNAPKSQAMVNDRRPVTEPEAVPAHLRGPRHMPLPVRMVRDLLAAVCAMVAFAIGVMWLLSALPQEMLPSIPGANALMDFGMPRSTHLSSLVHMTLAGGYDLGSALPFGIGFLAVFVGLGLLNRERWTAVWAPVVVLVTFWGIAG